MAETNAHSLPSLPDAVAFEYECIRKIGEGSNGETWLVKNRIHKTLAALKCLKINVIENIKNIELFNREVQLLKSIHIDGVPAFYQYATDDAGNGFLIQEYINAPSIQSLLDRGIIFSESDTLHIARQIANILFRLQTNFAPPIIHRDIKPSNILYDEISRKAFLIDFGAVTHPEKRSGGSTIAGTFGYMPPEQMIGDVAIQSDYYALGATMLHMLTGTFPGEIATNIYQLDFIPILDQYAPNLSAHTRSALQSLLAANIDERPANAMALVDLLARENLPQKLPFYKRAIHYIRNLFSSSNDIVIQTRNKGFQPIDEDFVTVEDLMNADPKYRCTLITRNWPICDGIIRKQITVPAKLDGGKELQCALEYTFEVNGDTWAGLRVVKHHQHISLPHRCRIAYYPNDPGLNVIYSIPEQ